MPRRVSLPGADELFRPTAEPPTSPPTLAEVPDRPSGRVKHDSKVTVYMTSDELLELEHARLSLRRDLGQTLDRGRLIREAVAMALAEYAENGADGELGRRLGAP